MLKGIQTVDDANKSVEVVVQGIVVSNHRRRQEDGRNSSLEMLPHILDAVGIELRIIFDSGIRSGEDITKALALDADYVLIRRPYLHILRTGRRGWCVACADVFDARSGVDATHCGDCER